MAKRKHKRSNMKKRARAGVKGLQVTWEDRDPLSESHKRIPGTVGHRNPIMRLCAEKIMQDHGDWITHTQPFRWLVKVTCYSITQTA